MGNLIVDKSRGGGIEKQEQGEEEGGREGSTEEIEATTGFRARPRSFKTVCNWSVLFKMSPPQLPHLLPPSSTWEWTKGSRRARKTDSGREWSFFSSISFTIVTCVEDNTFRFFSPSSRASSSLFLFLSPLLSSSLLPIHCF